MNTSIYEITDEYPLRAARLPWRQLLFTIFGFALALRLIIAGAYMNSYDTEWNIMWGIELGKGFFGAYATVTSLDYPPLYLYPLYVVGKLLTIDEIAGYPPFRMLAIKFLPCLADSLTCIVLFFLGRKRSRTWGAAAAGIWAVNPATIFNCAFWGQTDCVLLCLTALLFYALGERRMISSGILFAAMCCTKLQGLYLAPVVGMEVLTVCFGSLHYKKFHFRSIERRQVRRFARFVRACAATFTIIYLPFMIGASMASPHAWSGFFAPLSVYGGGVDKYRYVTMNADNIYMLFDCNGVSDEAQLLPGVSYSAVGTLFLLASVVLVPVAYVFGKRRSHWLTAYYLMEGIFMLTCRQHERYQILTLILLLGAFLQITDRRLLTVYSLQSLIILVNQSRVLGVVLERKSWWLDYRAGNPTINEMMLESQALVRQRGVWWVRCSPTIAWCNALLNVALFLAGTVLVLRFWFDDVDSVPFGKRVKDYYGMTTAVLSGRKGRNGFFREMLNRLIRCFTGCR